ncbi:SELP [Symbiodinium sp. CCMP2456]|nr:SELP [Symbiodinium sp. CCMP2456]
MTTKWLRPWCLWSIFHQAVADLAIVRPYASNAEVQSLQSVFDLWSEVLPCTEAPEVSVDVILVFSKTFEASPQARTAADAIKTQFENGTFIWAQCFRSLTVQEANLTAIEDVYDSRGYSIRKAWVTGPNKVFKSVLRAAVDKTVGEYSHFFYMELDSVPVREGWLLQYVAEALYYPTAAIRGSRYRGDTWDGFLKDLPLELLIHINGNAIYNVEHPWTLRLLAHLEDASFEIDSIAFDIKMANLSFEEFGNALDSPYKADSLLIGNYAQMLLNSSFESAEYIRHGSTGNIFDNIDDSQVTLGVMALAAEFSAFLDSLRYSHPFRKVLIMGSEILNETSYSINTLQGTTQIEILAISGDPVELYCELASQVTTRYLVLTNTDNIVSSPTSILVNGAGHPVLPYVNADSWYCGQFPSCLSELSEAEAFYGIQLLHHHDTFETVYYTSLFQQHCAARDTVLSQLGSYEDCDFVHGPTADGYMAWLLSQNGDLSFDYVPKSKTRVGSRTWGVLSKAHPVDLRECSVYTPEDFTVLDGNISSCAQILEDPGACDAAANCTWRPVFGSGRCIDTPANPEVTQMFVLPQFISSTTTTSTTTMTTTTTVTTTGTTTTQTFTVLPGQCPLPIAEPSVDVMDCLGKTVGETCEVVCSEDFEGPVSTLTCGVDESFTGDLPTCSTTTMTSTATSTVTELVYCSGGLPSGRGVVVSDCSGLANGQTCNATCDARFQGGPVQYLCNAMTGLFEGPGLVCRLPTCSLSALPLASTDVDASSCENTEVGSLCFMRCRVGFVFAESVLTCEADLSFSGTPPTCERLACGTSGLPEDVSFNVSSCIGTLSGESCEVACKRGYDGSSSTFRCGLDGVFQGSAGSCVRKACLPPASSPSFQTDCAGARHGDLCFGRCSPGYTGFPKQLACNDGVLLGDLPNCSARICSLEGIVIGVGVTAEACVGITTSSSCELGCVRGFEGSGSGTLNCEIDGSFSATGAFECRPKQCFPLSSISPFSEPHFADSCGNKEFGDICTAFCEPGWEIEGNATVMLCDDTPLSSAGFAEYLGRAPAENSSGPVCTAKPCTIGMPRVRGTSNDCSGKATLENCTVTALPGFTMTDSVLTCLTDHSFNGTISEVVEASCPDLAPTTGSASSCQDRKVGDECWVYCEPGYTGSPAAYICDANTLTFVPKDIVVTCTASSVRRLFGVGGCQEAATAAFGLADPQFAHDCTSGSGVADGGICIAHCSRGYGLVGVASVLSCNSGSLSGTLPVCSPLPCTYNLPDAVGLEHNCSNITTGSSCSAGCTQEGFKYASGGAEQYQCAITGEFQGTLPSCQRISCTDLILGRKFAHNCEGMVFQDTCGVSCAKGWTLVGWGSQYECQSDGNITGVLPDCVGNPCENSIPADQAFSGEECDGMTTGLACNVTCKPGSVPNFAIMTCDESGQLVGTLPLCKPAKCPVISRLEEPSVAHDCDDVAFGRSCGVYCAPGYELTSGEAGEATVQGCSVLPSPRSSLLLELDPETQAKKQHCLSFSSPTWVLYMVPGVRSGQPIVCPSLNPSDVLEDNCTGLLAVSGYGVVGFLLVLSLETGIIACLVLKSCERRCRSGFLPVTSLQEVDGCMSPNQEKVMDRESGAAKLQSYVPAEPRSYAKANATSSSFNCDLSGDWAATPVKKSAVRLIVKVFVNWSCFAYCRDGFQLSLPEAPGLDSPNMAGSQIEQRRTAKMQVPQWTCADESSGLPAVSDDPMVDGYTLRGVVPVCSALPCLYNLPFGAEYADDCGSGVVTDGTCTVTCAAGWQGGSSTLSAQKCSKRAKARPANFRFQGLCSV